MRSPSPPPPAAHFTCRPRQTRLAAVTSRARASASRRGSPLRRVAPLDNPREHLNIVAGKPAMIAVQQRIVRAEFSLIPDDHCPQCDLDPADGLKRQFAQPTVKGVEPPDFRKRGSGAEVLRAVIRPVWIEKSGQPIIADDFENAQQIFTRRNDQPACNEQVGQVLHLFNPSRLHLFSPVSFIIHPEIKKPAVRTEPKFHPAGFIVALHQIYGRSWGMNFWSGRRWGQIRNLG